MNTVEMKILRWMSGVGRKDRLWNEFIQNRLEGAPITDKLNENQLRWYGHVLRYPYRKSGSSLGRGHRKGSGKHKIVFSKNFIK